MAFGPRGEHQGPEANIATQQIDLKELQAEQAATAPEASVEAKRPSLRELGQQKREAAKNNIKQKAGGFKSFLSKTWGQMKDIGSHLVDFKQSELLRAGGAAKDAAVGAASTVAEAGMTLARGTRDTAVAFGGAAKDAAVGAAGAVAEAGMNLARGTRDTAVAFGGAAKDAAVGAAGAINAGIDVGFGAVSKEGRQQIAQDVGAVAGAAKDAAVGAARATGERLTSWDRSPVLKAGKESMSFLGRKSTELGEAAKSGWRSTLDTFSAAKEALRQKYLDTRINMAETKRNSLEKKINALRASKEVLKNVQPEVAPDEFGELELDTAV